MTSIAVRARTPGGWMDVDLRGWYSVADAEQHLLSMDGGEFVARLTSARRTVYLCGTKALIAKMAPPKGDASMSMADGVEYIRERRLMPRFVEAINQPGLDVSLSVFGGVINEIRIA